MSGNGSTGTSQKQHQREARKRQRELERQMKEMAKLSVLEQARLEVETYENTLELLLSIHKEQSDPVDWLSIASSLPPVPPIRQYHNEFKVRQSQAVSSTPKDAESLIDHAKQQDELAHQELLQTYATDYAEWEKRYGFARRVLNGDSGVYIDVITELNPFSELANVGSSLHIAVHNQHFIEVVLRTNGNQGIPSEAKTLTASGKVSVKTMPKPRFIEIYQDYICSCILRVARELFALLPLEILLITASVEAVDTSTGQTAQRPFLSVAIPRKTLNQLNFERLDPSDSILGMAHRGDLQLLRKTGEFESITPLTTEEVYQQNATDEVPFDMLLASAKRLCVIIAKQRAGLNPELVETSFENGETT